jgi:hypothetical protein
VGDQDRISGRGAITRSGASADTVVLRAQLAVLSDVTARRPQPPVVCAHPWRRMRPISTLGDDSFWANSQARCDRTEAGPRRIPMSLGHASARDRRSWRLAAASARVWPPGSNGTGTYAKPCFWRRLSENSQVVGCITWNRPDYGSGMGRRHQEPVGVELRLPHRGPCVQFSDNLGERLGARRRRQETRTSAKEVAEERLAS